MVRTPSLAAAVLLVAALGRPALAAVINVPGDFATIQAAIDAAVDTDEIIVAPGTYFETINFLGKAFPPSSSAPISMVTGWST